MQSQPVLADLVKVIIYSTLMFVLKVQHVPNLSTVCNTLNILQTKAKMFLDNAAQMLNAVKQEPKTKIKNTANTVYAIATNVQLNTRAGEEAMTLAKEVVEVGKANLQIARQIKNIGTHTGSAISYTTIVAKGVTLAGTVNIQVPRIASMQTQYKVVVTIRDLSTVLSLQVINLCNLNAHVERAII
jgi:hypothetical protein